MLTPHYSLADFHYRGDEFLARIVPEWFSSDRLHAACHFPRDSERNSRPNREPQTRFWILYENLNSDCLATANQGLDRDSSRPFRQSHRPFDLQALDDYRDPLPAADTRRCQTVASVSPLQLEQQRQH